MKGIFTLLGFLEKGVDIFITITYLSQHQADLVDNGVTVSKQFHVKCAVRQWLPVDQDLRSKSGFMHDSNVQFKMPRVTVVRRKVKPGEHFPGERRV